ncbi:MAG: glycerol-3-phosphate 1-O-acyltransferase PlsY [Candidatus Omnitrophica bacterium]|nr:glycerol-3-phosphate 1-O-acyltransferase PlsY [Candidatus Omnitrophota bacterium]
MIPILGGLLLSYLLGSIPTAYLFGRIFNGIDIRQHGSGNVGATNAFRILGKKLGTIVLLLDILKGVIAITVIGNIFHLDLVYLRVLLGVMVVIGHNWTVFLQFKGGKGIATSLGVLIGLAIQYEVLRIVLALTLFAWIVPFIITGYVSLASLIAAVVLPLAMFSVRTPIELRILGLVFCVFVVVRHIENIKRLLAGQERRVNFPFKRK